jgi:signal peptidase I
VLALLKDILLRRRLRKHAKETVRAARHILNMREDVMSPEDVRSVRDGVDKLRVALASGDFATQVPAAMDALGETLGRVAPTRPYSAAREYVEVIVVAVSVAVGFKTYFFQPFKIPTGSMQPTLYGVHVSQDAAKPFLYLDAGKPVKFLRMPSMDVNGFSERTVVTGERYVEIRAACSGTVGAPGIDPDDPTVTVIPVGNLLHHLPVGPSELMRNDVLRVRIGSLVEKGDVLCRLTTAAGDHVLVNRMALNFRRPRRDDVIVFSTLGIQGLVQGTHYIKRLVGLPNERIGVQPPNLMVNGSPVTGFRGIDRVTANQGYQPCLPADSAVVVGTNATLDLGPREYAGFGDNTGNSRDSRFWGAIPEPNLVGPAVFVYWPFSSRWGLIR